ncbi:MAG: HD domain-containing protein [Candidatus Hodarchaeales archaeon]|jgi:GTP pyrophosphokinase
MKVYDHTKNNFLDSIKKHSILQNHFEIIQKALVFGERRHQGQTRIGGKEPYFIHTIRVALTLINEEDTDKDLVISGLLHDIIEDTDTDIEEINHKFGKKVSLLVKGMTKLPSSQKRILGKEKYYQIGFFGPLVETARYDNRIWKLKLSDRIDNLTDYLNWASKRKIVEYLWESEKLLNYANEANINSPQINNMKKALIPYYNILGKEIPNK